MARFNNLVSLPLPEDLKELTVILDTKVANLTFNMSLGKLNTVLNIRCARIKKSYAIDSQATYDLVKTKMSSEDEQGYDILCEYQVNNLSGPICSASKKNFFFIINKSKNK